MRNDLPVLAIPMTHAASVPPRPVVEVDRIAHAFGRHTVIDGLSFSLTAGTIACLLGPSGCGKTTVLRAIAGFETLRAGEIRIDGEVVSSAGSGLPPEHRRIGMVFQDYALFPHLTIADNVGFGLIGTHRTQRDARVREMLALVGLHDAGNRYPHELSGGQQQRVALARALAPRPALLLLDEPFSNLDIDLRERLGQEVRDILRAQGTTAILVTHDQHEAFAMADEIGVMHGGRIEQWGDAHTLYHQPATRFVAGFIGQGVLLRGRVRKRAIALAIGTLPWRNALALADGTEVDVLIRPDDLVHDDAGPLRGRVLDKAFRGASILYTLQLDDGSRVLALVPSHHDLPPGATLGLRVEADDVIAFEAGAFSRSSTL